MSAILSHVEAVLAQVGLEVAEVRELPTGLGWQLRCPGGEIVVVYRTGKTVAQGRNQAAIRAVLAAAPVAPHRPARARASPAASTPPPAQAEIASPAPAQDAGSRLPPGWTTAPWDGITVPF